MSLGKPISCRPNGEHCAHWYDGEPCCTCSDQRFPVAKGQRWSWQGLTYVITRVARDARWADIKVEGDGGWVKRQPLPLPAGSVLLRAEQ